jgi:hypothetical protein
LELVLLRNLKKTKDEKELSQLTNVDRKIITTTLDELFEADYIGEDSMVTEKGFEILNQRDIRVKDESSVELSALETLLLKSVNRSMNDKSLSKLAQVDLTTVSGKLDRLYEQNLITEDLMLTKRGYNILHRGSELTEEQAPQVDNQERESKGRRTDASTRVVVIQREVIKIPCRYCGMLVDPVRDAKCPSCGANLSMRRS